MSCSVFRYTTERREVSCPAPLAQFTAIQNSKPCSFIVFVLYSSSVKTINVQFALSFTFPIWNRPPLLWSTDAAFRYSTGIRKRHKVIQMDFLHSEVFTFLRKLVCPWILFPQVWLTTAQCYIVITSTVTQSSRNFLTWLHVTSITEPVCFYLPYIKCIKFVTVF